MGCSTTNMIDFHVEDMSTQTFNLTFNGYWREPNIGGIPTECGVYCVYVCRFKEAEKTVSLRKIIFIGSSDNARLEIANDPHWADWLNYREKDEQICFSFAPIEPIYRERVMAALIFRHRPPGNKTFLSNFPFEKTAVISAGRVELLDKNFSVDPA